MPVGFPDEEDPLTRTLPVIDPTPAPADSSQNSNCNCASYDSDSLPPEHQLRYLTTAIRQRRQLAETYLNRWNADRLVVFEHDARMSAYYPLWRIATCGHLEQLLTEEYPYRNLPMQIRLTNYGADVESKRSSYAKELQKSRYDEAVIAAMRADPTVDLNQHLEDNFNFVAVVYRRPLEEMAPGLFHNPLARQNDAQTYAQVRLFIPRGRRHLSWPSGGGDGTIRTSIGGGFGTGEGPPIVRGTPGQPRPPREISPCETHWVGEGWPQHWDLLNQHWMVQLVPATARKLAQILEADPSYGTGSQDGPAQFRTPNLGGADIQKINKH